MSPETGNPWGKHNFLKKRSAAIDESLLPWYNALTFPWEEAIAMSEQVKKTPCGIGLLAHVCANR